jgi:carbamoyltransferase
MKSPNPLILSIQYGGHDTAAALMREGKIVAACEEERYNREKHTRDFPKNAIRECLRLAHAEIQDIDEIAWCMDPILYIQETYLKSAMEDPARIGALLQDASRIRRFYEMETTIREQTGFQGKVFFHRHHLCHAASAYYASGFENALVATYDGIGEIDTQSLWEGKDGELKLFHPGVRYPHSLGLFYSAITHYLGWRHHCDEGIVMGLAAHGDPSHYSGILSEIIRETGDYTYEIDLSWTAYQHVRDVWVSKKFLEYFGPKRESGSEILPRHKDLAASVQRRLEEIVINQLERAQKQTGLKKLALAGGVALNCSLNGALARKKIFDEIFVQPASGDAGATLGACFLSHLRLTGSPPVQAWSGTYLGTSFSNDEILEALKRSKLSFQYHADILNKTASLLAEGAVVGWFQGRAEFGPRALGNRSLLARPYPNKMKDYLNEKIKFRETFRPFAPAVPLENARDYFEIAQPSPHMLIAARIRPEKREKVPAIVHIDETCRVQTVTETENPRFHSLLKAFEKLSGCPVLLNTSFNVKGEPIVNTPDEAIACFQSTPIDFLVLGDYCVSR